MPPYKDLEASQRSLTTSRTSCKNLLLIISCAAFSIGLLIGLGLALLVRKPEEVSVSSAIKSVFVNNSYKESKVSFVQPSEDYIKDDIFWGDKVEKNLPEGYRGNLQWTDYLSKAVGVKLQPGCGRMQNRMLVFEDGVRGCVRYRQNTDQIQGEVFSFYLAQVLGLPNLAPSGVSVVDLRSPLWRNLGSEISAAQWSSNKPVVVTQWIGGLGSAAIPGVFRPSERHLDKFDVLNMTGGGVGPLLELAQWSDLIVFDYLTANLDRVVNNLYNYQWNVNIMDAPAHNLAKKLNSELLLFLDNESGLLHGYRLLKKYEIYHSLLLENLCVFRRATVEAVRGLKLRGDVGTVLRGMFEKENSDTIKDLLPTLPDKSVKILNERIDKVYQQIEKCQAKFSNSNKMWGGKGENET